MYGHNHYPSFAIHYTMMYYVGTIRSYMHYACMHSVYAWTSKNILFFANNYVCVYMYSFDNACIS